MARARQDHPTRVTALLLQIAGILDLAVSLVALRILLEVAGIQPDDWKTIAPVALGVVVGHWLVIEVLLQGRSLGRAALGVEVRTASGQHPSTGRGLRRFLARALGFWRGLGPGQLAPYNAGPDLSWHVSLAGGMVMPRSASGPPGKDKAPGPNRHFRLKVMDGPHRGLTLRSADVDEVRKRGVLRIGRHPDWADLNLPRNPKVSRQHAEIRLTRNGLILHDVGSDGKGSSHGTFVHGRRVPPGGSVELGNADQIQIADTRIQLLR